MPFLTWIRVTTYVCLFQHSSLENPAQCWTDVANKYTLGLSLLLKTDSIFTINANWLCVWVSRLFTWPGSSHMFCRDFVRKV